ncbi:mitochondrial ribonuclease P catalytic subunit [Bombus pascuorum]|uniref:mitochondrial ribonuclease P catalytic subunit n=1 Tax=Bombus pascuorum TaxID=65598 RepID=UPI002120467F|nr:mitochondrial ribonuclease P catalytic subunit [Bombus pascuorum]
MFSYVRQTSVQLYNCIQYTIIRNASTITTNKKFNNYWQHVLNNCENALTQSSTISKETWECVRKRIQIQCNSSNYDFIILDMFQHMNYPDAGISYYKFLVDNNYKPPVSVTIKYLELYKIKEDPILESDKEYILSLYNDISNQYTSFNAELSTVFIGCLCKIGKWEEAIKIIEKYEKDDILLLRQGYTSLISYFFNHEKENLGYEYLERSLQKGKGPFGTAYNSYLYYCLKEKDTFNTKVEKLFLLWNAYGVKPSEVTAFMYMNACIEHGWSVSKTVVSRSRCQKCKKTISQQRLSDKDYERLLEATKERLIFNKMYYVTHPQEIQSYINFIDKNKPYDLIVDGLNIMYIAKNDITQKKLREFIQIIKSYKEQNKKVLVIGRRHMKKFVAKTGLQDADCFFVEDDSKDDLFLLYAAFASGENARIISRDLLRQHVFALHDIELNVLFKKWQLSHQFFVDQWKGYIQLNALKPIDAIVQKQNNTWHIPYVTNEESRKRHTCNYSWLCFEIR